MKNTDNKVTITKEIEFCNDCFFASCKSKQVGLSTNNDYLLDWHCSKLDKKIKGAVDYGENVKIPEICPFKTTQNNS